MPDDPVLALTDSAPAFWLGLPLTTLAQALTVAAVVRTAGEADLGELNLDILARGSPCSQRPEHCAARLKSAGSRPSWRKPSSQLDSER